MSCFLDFRAHHELVGGPSAPGWRRRPPQPLPSTPGGEPLDAPDFGLSKIKDKVCCIFFFVSIEFSGLFHINIEAPEIFIFFEKTFIKFFLVNLMA